MSSETTDVPGPAASAEENIGIAVQRLREDMPKNFILIYENESGGKAGYQIISHCSLNAAQGLLKFGIAMISDQYAVGQARAATKEPLV